MTLAAASTLAVVAPPAAWGSRYGVWVLILGAVLISFSGIFVRISELGPSATAFHRLFLALPIFWLWMAQEIRDEPDRLPLHLRDWWLLALCGLFMAGDLVFWHWSLRMTSVANATLLGNSAPVFVTLAGWLLFGQRFSRLYLAGLLLAFGGAAVLVGISFGHGERPFLGDLLGIIVGAFYGGYIMLVGRLRGRLSTATVMGVSGVFTCLALLPVALASGESLTAHTLNGWVILAEPGRRPKRHCLVAGPSAGCLRRRHAAGQPRGRRPVRLDDAGRGRRPAAGRRGRWRARGDRAGPPGQRCPRA